MAAVRSLCAVAGRGLVLPCSRLARPAWRSAGAVRSKAVGIEALPVPDYFPVPPRVESADEVMAEMPELILSGPGPLAAGKDNSVRSAVAGVSLEVAIALEEPPAQAGVGNGQLPRFAQLDNGVRICSVDRHGLCSSVGLFVHTGSRYQPVDTASLPHMLELMAFRSTDHLSQIRTLKTLEQLGATASCRVGREDLLYQVDCLREYVPVVLPLLLANVLSPTLAQEEVTAAHQQVGEVQLSLEENTESLLSELLHVHAYKGNTLGHPLYAEDQDLSKFTAEGLRAYLAEHCTPDKMIVVGVNTDFDELCKWTGRCFSNLGPPQSATPSAPPNVPAVYTGGDLRIQRPNPLCHLMLGWEVSGGWNGELLAAVTVLQMFLGGGGSFSTGGPGKGMHTRLYTHVLNRHHWVESCQASSVMYADSGLFTIYATVEPPHADKFVNVLAGIFSGLSRISPEELARAKNALKSSIHMNLEMRAVMVEDIGRQLVLAGKVGTAQEFGKMVDAVTGDDMRNALKHCLGKKPTVVAYGAADRVPRYERIEELLNPGILESGGRSTSLFGRRF